MLGCGHLAKNEKGFCRSFNRFKPPSFLEDVRPIGIRRTAEALFSQRLPIVKDNVQAFFQAPEPGVAAASRWPYINPKFMNATLKMPNFLNWGKILDKKRPAVIIPSSTMRKMRLFINSASSLAMTAASSPKHGR
jgi:hypothetical protein